MHLIYLVNLYFIPYLGQKYFNIPKSVLYIRKLAVGLLIIANKSVMT